MKFYRAAFAAVAACLCLAGCSMRGVFATDDMLRPPQVYGEEAGVSEAVKLAAGGDAVYVPPRSGDYRSAIIFKDLTLDGEREALAFYSAPRETGAVNVMLLKRQGGKWSVLAQAASPGNDINSVIFNDMNNDGRTEILVSWITAGDEKILSVYSSDFTVLFEEKYKDMVVTDMDGDINDEILLLSGGGAAQWRVVMLKTGEDGAVSEVGSVLLDPGMKEFSGMEIDSEPLDPGADGRDAAMVYIYGAGAGGAAISQAVRWDKETGALKAAVFNK